MKWSLCTAMLLLLLLLLLLMMMLRMMISRFFISSYSSMSQSDNVTQSIIKTLQWTVFKQIQCEFNALEWNCTQWKFWKEIERIERNVLSCKSDNNIQSHCQLQMLTGVNRKYSATTNCEVGALFIEVKYAPSWAVQSMISQIYLCKKGVTWLGTRRSIVQFLSMLTFECWTKELLLHFMQWLLLVASPELILCKAF